MFSNSKNWISLSVELDWLVRRALLPILIQVALIHDYKIHFFGVMLIALHYHDIKNLKSSQWLMYLKVLSL